MLFAGQPDARHCRKAGHPGCWLSSQRTRSTAATASSGKGRTTLYTKLPAASRKQCLHMSKACNCAVALMQKLQQFSLCNACCLSSWDSSIERSATCGALWKFLHTKKSGHKRHLSRECVCIGSHLVQDRRNNNGLSMYCQPILHAACSSMVMTACKLNVHRQRCCRQPLSVTCT